ncbi:LytTR family two component transcriptional regulator [Nitritalea halalkaliphila LW7]|uniref:LytTR family two component transcriptional regulator n=1 Tax=Nitritalea halalkaliphila LW7 TaxID=1189621 RepID=I5C5Q2_9BACT|nr:response regulator [Nitritalea halalkaliphila]EIM77154.1 LytTR family two component transcriptional regulator [Nitritalea halalkaliphila LW7]
MKEDRILIVEDELDIAENIQEILGLLEYQHIDIANSANQAVKLIKRSKPDLIFMDIKLKGDKDGIELGEMIKNMVDAPLVYVTSYSDPSIIERAKRVHPAGFIVKPFTTNDIHAITEIAMFNSRNQPKVELPTAVPQAAEALPDAIFIRSGIRYTRVGYEEIIYVNASGNIVTVHTDKKEFVVRKSLREMEEILSPHGFLRVQKSYMVSLRRIEAFTTKEIFMDNGVTVQIGRQYYSILLSRLNIIIDS